MIAIRSPFTYYHLNKLLFRNRIKQVKGFVLFMSQVSSKKTSQGIESSRSVEQKLQDYLDGYFLSFDFYPVCERQLFAKNDAYALLREFWSVGSDLNKEAQNLISAPEHVSQHELISDNKIKRQKIETARKAIQAIRRSRSRDDTGEKSPQES